MSEELKKPAYGSPCNGCGWCCQQEVCSIGRMVFGGAIDAVVEGPCPALTEKDGRFLCGVVIAEQEMLDEAGSKEIPRVPGMLGIGWGCDSRTEDEMDLNRFYVAENGG